MTTPDWAIPIYIQPTFGTLCENGATQEWLPLQVHSCVSPDLFILLNLVGQSSRRFQFLFLQSAIAR